jgi:YVTN family beta-propeller protein
VWYTLKDTGKVQVFDARPPFALLKTIETGPITNHVNIVHNANGTFAYATIGGLNEVKVFRTSDFVQIATISVGNLPHGIWPSGDGTRVYVGLENGAQLVAIDTLTNKVIGSVAIGQAPQAVVYVPGAVPEGAGTANLRPLGQSGDTVHLAMVPATGNIPATPPTSVALFDQGLVQVLQAAVTGLAPKRPYVLALAARPDGSGTIEPLARFTTNPAGSAIVNTIGPIRQVVHTQGARPRRYLVILPDTNGRLGPPEQVQAP